MLAGGLAQDAEQRRLVRDRVRKKVLESRTVHELHEDVGEPVLLEDVVNGNNVRVREDARGLRFPKEALAEPVPLGGVGQVLQPDALDGNGAPDGRVLGAIDDTHGSPPQLTDNLKSPDLLHDGFRLF